MGTMVSSILGNVAVYEEKVGLDIKAAEMTLDTLPTH